MTRSFALVGIMVWMSAALADDTIYTDPDKAAAVFPFQGEYVGKVKTEKGEAKVGLHVGALGGSHYHAIRYGGGLPGEGWDKKHKDAADGEVKDGALVFEMRGTEVKIKDGVAVSTNLESRESFRLDKVKRSSPTLGAKPPEGAVVLFDGKSADAFDGGKMTDDGLLEPGCTSKQKFGSCKLHIEFRTLFCPTFRTPSTYQLGSCGVYVSGRHEVIIHDSFCRVSSTDKVLCGALSENYIIAPDVNMCLPPLTWQTYDIDYTAAKFAGDLQVKRARVTIRQNGVVIHNDVELLFPSAGAPITKPGAELGPILGPIHLRDYDGYSMTQFRNIWMVDMEREERERNKRAVEDALTRTWEDPTGKIKVTARLTAVLRGPVAQLTKDDGTVIEKKFFQLKTTDRKWIIESGKALLEKLKEFEP